MPDAMEPRNPQDRLPADVRQRILVELAAAVAARAPQVEAAVALFDEGATVPFIARYRKEATGGLDDVQLRGLAALLGEVRERELRRIAVRESIAGQGHLTPALAAAIDAATTRQALEDLYLPYKPRRRTRAQAAREAGLEPLADALLADAALVPLQAAAAFVNPEAGIADPRAALDGARDILAERFAERADVLGAMRERLWSQGWLHASVVEDRRSEGDKFRDWFDHHEPIAAIPSHRALALLRGRQAGVLSLRLGLDVERDALLPHPCVLELASLLGVAEVHAASPGTRDAWLAEVVRWCWRVKLLPALETELVGRMREAAQAEAIRVFGANVKDLLLAPPARGHAVIGLDPGLRTGVKVAVVDATGRLLDTATVFPHEPRRDWDGAIATLAALAREHGAGLVAIGNGTASRETDRLAAELIARHPDLGLRRVTVSEAGASVYSASELAAREFPDLDVSLRGAVSIARRLLDPLAELVKIDPRSIGVGQYQHDVDQRQLARQLDAVVEDCVNAVGVDLNTASASLLARVSGLGPTLAERIVAHRERHGAFVDRRALLAVGGVGERTFELAAGFLRIVGGANPLDASAVHPEAYPVVERILERLRRPAEAVIGQPSLLSGLRPREFADERFGEPTVRDILAELEKPGRDPRGEFAAAAFDDAVRDLADLRPGMKLRGVVTNVANFGAFVDIGVHQDGLVHVSELAERFVRDPRDVVRTGQAVQVTVMEVDAQRQRIALSMRADADPAMRAGRRTQTAGAPAGSPGAGRARPTPAGRGAAPPGAGATALAQAFRRATKH